ncbi:diguanylate cyclase domain-containing protein [Modestobacter sp. URMC 112]
MDRRAAGASSGAYPRPGVLRRALRALRDGLYRPLAGDDDRVAYWLRHVRIGVLVSEVASWCAIGYVFLTDSPGRHSAGILIALALVVVGCPCVLLLPLREMMRDSRGPTLFYVWSLAETAVVVYITRLDGGSSSPLDALLFLALTYAAVAYSPYGVVAMGGIMTLSHLVVVELPDVSTSGLFFMVVMGSFTLICAMASANSWAVHDRQVMLIRTQEALASTDPLTGIPNRRAFMERVTGAVDAADGRRTVVCLVDLDGFKAVNDTRGHAAGDGVLKAVGSALSAVVRETDTVARLGGDEFAVLAEVSVTFSGEVLAERLRAAVALVGADCGVTASVGVAEIELGDDVGDLMHRADAAMYRSKTAGGDRVSTLTH